MDAHRQLPEEVRERLTDLGVDPERVVVVRATATKPVPTLDDTDIELVVAQCSCTPEAARAALIKHDNDIVEAIMDLTIE
jgi:hypothetical protein